MQTTRTENHPCCKEISSSPSDAASTKRGVPSSTGWKRDRNTPSTQLQPLSRPLQAPSITAPKEGSWLAKRNPLLPGPALLASAAPQTAGACRMSAALKGVTAEGTLCNPASHAITAPSSQKATGGFPRPVCPCAGFCLMEEGIAHRKCSGKKRMGKLCPRVLMLLLF